ncbi:RNA-binding domain-containing protein [Pleurotus eryngii]|uniref:RNA-binding domain-containing protein n=1 Tax=Pleurotus eryngii TaxID=5323 RepID=A0A9P6A239_PLEER|nr:RNA-binding domain-containing protein [Pleurotus eryngii]
MNVVREIGRINELELKLGSSASWHDEYKDSAYIFIGGLNFELTEGDVITIFSQYGEVMDVNMPRDKETGKPRGFAFLMYEDQRSTVLAVDNLNGAQVLEKTLRVDHVKNYKQPKAKGDDGEWVEAEEQSLNAKPQLILDDAAASESSESGPDIDPEDPMRDFLLAKWREEKALKKPKKKKRKDKRKDETPEERRAREARKKEKKARKQTSDGMRGVEALLSSFGRPREGRDRSRSPSSRKRLRSRSNSPHGRHTSLRRTPPRSPSPARRRDRYDERDRDKRDHERS